MLTPNESEGMYRHEFGNTGLQKKERGEQMLTIKQIRVGADLTLKSASELCGCSIPTFQKWEEEPRKMELGAFSNLVDYYNKKNPTRQILYTDVEF